MNSRKEYTQPKTQPCARPGNVEETVRRVCQLIFCIIPLVLVGCGGPPKLDIQTHNGKTRGVAYLICGKGKVEEKVAPNGDVDVTLGANHLEIKGNRVLANGKDKGIVKDGDSIVLDNQGLLFVNQQKR